MDPLTHTVLGATAAHAFTSKKLGRGALLFGAAGGFLPDMDVLWGPFVSDPALPWEHHRHFTHALAFIPVGGAIAAAPLLLIFKRFRPMAGWAYLAATIGWATHGLNDTLTSFGTYLYWPFSNELVAWDVISIIDPAFTLPLLLGIVLAIVLRRAWPTTIAFALALAYVMLGFVQNQRVLGVQERLAAQRGHVLAPGPHGPPASGRGRAMPTIGNLLIWRSLYEADGALHADAVRASIFGPVRVREGASIPAFDAADLSRHGIDAGQPHEVFEKFSAFAGSFTALAADDESSVLIGDMRYSLNASEFEPLWGIRIQRNIAGRPDSVEWVNIAAGTSEGRGAALSRLWHDLVRPGPDWAHVPR